MFVCVHSVRANSCCKTRLVSIWVALWSWSQSNWKSWCGCSHLIHVALTRPLITLSHVYAYTITAESSLAVFSSTVWRAVNRDAEFITQLIRHEWLLMQNCLFDPPYKLTDKIDKHKDLQMQASKCTVCSATTWCRWVGDELVWNLRRTLLETRWRQLKVERTNCHLGERNQNADCCKSHIHTHTSPMCTVSTVVQSKHRTVSVCQHVLLTLNFLISPYSQLKLGLG